MKKHTPSKLFVTILIIALLPSILFGQSRRKKNGTFISLTTSINYYPYIPNYRFPIRSSFRTVRELELAYMTSTSGFFEVDEFGLTVERLMSVDLPTQLVSPGLGIRWQKENKLVHELSLSKFSLVKSAITTTINEYDIDGDVYSTRTNGYIQRSGRFAIRYEIGKIFGRDRDGVRFGLAAGIEPGYYFYRREPASAQAFPINADMWTLDFALIPSLTIKLAEKAFIDLKPMVNFWAAEIKSRVDEANPVLLDAQQIGETDPPVMRIAFALQFRYVLKVPRRRRY